MRRLFLRVTPRRLKNSCTTPILTGEDIYLKEGFMDLFEKQAIAICHPDIATSGGLLETKKIGDLAMVMIRRYPLALLVGFALGALPWAIANAALLSWIPISEAAYGLDDEEAMLELSRYTAWMMLLVRPLTRLQRFLA